MTPPGLILASGSSSRRTMLAAAGVPFMTAIPEVDEAKVQADMSADVAADARSTAEVLAECKALSVSKVHSGKLVIGSDQILVCEGRLFSKATDDAGAYATLRSLRGRAHELISSVVIAKEQDVIWRCTDAARLVMRDFSDVFLDEYLRAELPDVLGSVGCYRIEGRGAQLFARIEGDQFTIRGLPLIPLLAALRTQGALPT